MNREKLALEVLDAGYDDGSTSAMYAAIGRARVILRSAALTDEQPQKVEEPTAQTLAEAPNNSIAPLSRLEMAATRISIAIRNARKPVFLNDRPGWYEVCDLIEYLEKLRTESRLAEQTPELNRAVVNRDTHGRIVEGLGNGSELNEQLSNKVRVEYVLDPLSALNFALARLRGLDDHVGVAKVKELIAAAPQPTAETCTWAEDEDGHWDTSCGDRYTFIDGGPTDNGLQFCGYCGKSLKEAKHGQ